MKNTFSIFQMTLISKVNEIMMEELIDQKEVYERVANIYHVRTEYVESSYVSHKKMEILEND